MSKSKCPHGRSSWGYCEDCDKASLKELADLRAQLSAAIARAEKAERELTEAGAPDPTCAACGSSGPFAAVRYDIPGEAVEYDTECKTCGSLDVAESSAEAASTLGDRLGSTLDALTAERQKSARLTEALELTLTWSEEFRNSTPGKNARRALANPAPEGVKE